MTQHTYIKHVRELQLILFYLGCAPDLIKDYNLPTGAKVLFEWNDYLELYTRKYKKES